MKSFLKKFIVFFLLSVVIIIGCLQIFVFKGDLFKYKATIILSGSMEPTLLVDDLAFIKKTDKVEVGDIITFHDDRGNKVMHRIIEINGDEITTKGDANNVSDEPITKDQVDGIYVGKIKYVGKIFRLLRSPLGLLFVFIFIVIFVLSPSGKKEKSDEKAKTTKSIEKNEIKQIDAKLVFVGVMYAFILSACIIGGYNANYKQGLAGKSVGVVAKWDNSIKMTKSNINLDSINNKATFELTSRSETAVSYSILVDNISKYLGIQLSNNDNVSASIIRTGNTFKVNFSSDDNNTVEFDINRLRTESYTINDVVGTYEVRDSQDVYTFKDNISNRAIEVIWNDEKYKLCFINFGQFLVEGFKVKKFTLAVNANFEEVAGLDSLEDLQLSAIFEQIG